MTFFTEKDKQRHMVGSAILVHIFYAITLDPIGSFLLMVTAGLLKEFIDTNTMPEHVRDMLANVIGASTVFAWLLL